MSAYMMDIVFFTSDFPTMGWKWTIQDPIPIHVYHNILWESKYEFNFTRFVMELLCHSFKLFFWKSPRLSKEAQPNFTIIGKWFGEELFTYVIFYGSISKPHVLPLYVLDKLLAREIAYETVGHGLTKALKEAKKSV